MTRKLGSKNKKGLKPAPVCDACGGKRATYAKLCRKCFNRQERRIYCRPIYDGPAWIGKPAQGIHKATT